MAAVERVYQAKLIKRIKAMIPGCMVLKTNPDRIQGIPDLLVLWCDQWAALEVKRSEDAPYRPNQKFYIALLDKWSFARSIYPENEEEVLDELARSFKV